MPDVTPSPEPDASPRDDYLPIAVEDLGAIAALTADTLVMGSVT